eukprot:SAG31_NODE_235_length_19695_cov_37.959790_10_plen_75_part_00
MVDTFANAPVLSKTTAHKELAEELRQRDGGACHQLCMDEHMQQLQQSYAKALEASYSVNTMKSNDMALSADATE